MEKQLLVVDDDSSIRDLLDVFFSSEGFQVSTAINGDQALEHVSGSTPDMILMDLNMPVLDGIAAIKVLKGDPATSEILVYAMSARPIIWARASELLADGIITKPFDLPVLLEEVVECLCGAE